MEAPLSLRVTGLPAGVTEDQVSKVFGQYGTVLSCRLQQGAQGVEGLISMPASYGQWVVSNLNNNIPLGMPGPVGVQSMGPDAGAAPGAQAPAAGGAMGPDGGAFAQQAGAMGMAGQPGMNNAMGFKGNGKGPGSNPNTTTDDNLYVRGLPAELTEERMKEIFSQYCTVVSCKVLPMTAGKPDAAGFVRCKTSEQAQWIIDNLNGRTPQGMQNPIVVRMAGPSRPNPDGFDKGFKGDGFDKGKGKFKGKDFKGKGKGKKGDEGTTLYVRGLPTDVTEEKLHEVFGQYSMIMSCKVLPVAPGKNSAAGFVRMAEADAQWAIENLNGSVPTGLDDAIMVQLAGDKGKGDGKGKDGKGMGELMTAEVEESDNLYVRGIPGETTEETLQQVFGQLGTVTSVKLLAPQDKGFDKGKCKGKGKGKAACLIRMGSPAEAKIVMELLDGKPLPGTYSNLIVRYSGDGVPLVQKALKKIQTGDTLHVGQIRCYDAEKKHALIVDEDVAAYGCGEVFAAHQIVAQSRAGPGDTVIYFVHWKGNSAHAAPPMMRIGAEHTEAKPDFALKGWFKGVADPTKGFGFLQCPDLTTLFGKDTYVNKDLAMAGTIGYVRFNARLIRDRNDNSLKPHVTHMEPCEEDWKTIPADLSMTRESETVKPKGKSKGKCGGGDGWGGGAAGGYSKGDWGGGESETVKPKGKSKGKCGGGDGWGGGAAGGYSKGDWSMTRESET
eukprot:CAMPEP_0117488644 /NCGR_PEP_ID=MMETSP0784-20121206/16622_1 /TAXON_ID=39447 /ORGANISM="" /LENGTH=720 /DNA_ID=CAMNT_0005283339 /DNA_START=37 /DNA_END=2197 /DNA_ORIENTATION=+